MALFDTKKERAALVLGLLAVGLAVAMGPYVSGLLGAPVLYVIFAPLHRFLSRKLPRSLAAGLVILIAFLLIVLPGAWLIGMLDRKSTRLNSSHLVISYAVFCLKRKKRNKK